MFCPLYRNNVPGAAPGSKDFFGNSDACLDASKHKSRGSGQLFEDCSLSLLCTALSWQFTHYSIITGFSLTWPTTTQWLLCGGLQECVYSFSYRRMRLMWWLYLIRVQRDDCMCPYYKITYITNDWLCPRRISYLSYIYCNHLYKEFTKEFGHPILQICCVTNRLTDALLVVKQKRVPRMTNMS